MPVDRLTSSTGAREVCRCRHELIEPAELARASSRSAVVPPRACTEHVKRRETTASPCVSEVMDEMTGLGPLEPLLKDPTIADILINGQPRFLQELVAHGINIPGSYFDPSKPL